MRHADMPFLHRSGKHLQLKHIITIVSVHSHNGLTWKSTSMSHSSMKKNMQHVSSNSNNILCMTIVRCSIRNHERHLRLPSCTSVHQDFITMVGSARNVTSKLNKIVLESSWFPHLSWTNSLSLFSRNCESKPYLFTWLEQKSLSRMANSNQFVRSKKLFWKLPCQF